MDDSQGKFAIGFLMRKWQIVGVRSWRDALSLKKAPLDWSLFASMMAEMSGVEPQTRSEAKCPFSQT